MKKTLSRLKRNLRTHLGVEEAKHFDHVLPREVVKMMKLLHSRGFHLELVRDLSVSEDISEEDKKLVLALEEMLNEAGEDE